MKRIESALVLALGAGVTAGCTLGNTTNLYVPFAYQEKDGYCVPASIQMWYRSDHSSNSGPSQSSIASDLGWSSSGHTNPVRIPATLAHFTYTFDAFLDMVSAANEDDKAGFFSRQISVVDFGEPVLAIVELGYHAGILTGGNWSTRSDGYKQWNNTTFHDPDPNGGGPNIYFVAADWIYTICGPGISTCQQVVSFGAVFGWQNNLLNFGNQVKVRGLRTWPPRDWPPEI